MWRIVIGPLVVMAIAVAIPVVIAAVGSHRARQGRLAPLKPIEPAPIPAAPKPVAPPLPEPTTTRLCICGQATTSTEALCARCGQSLPVTSP
jgi:hypothetical protein